MRFELHPLCALFPRMSGQEFEALKADIKANGLRQPIVTHQGMILDGGNRYAACMEVGVKPLMTEYTGSNLVTYVLSANFYRRHLSEGQQSAIVASATDWAKVHRHGGDRKSDQAEGLPLETVKQRAAMAGVTERTQRDADKLVRENPAAAEQVIKGEKSLYRAVKELKPAKKTKPARFDPPPPPPEAEGADDAIQILSEENDRLNDRLAVAAMDATPDERRAAEQTIADLRAMVKTLTVELNAVKASRDALMRDNNDMKQQLAGQRKQLAKFKASA